MHDQRRTAECLIAEIGVDMSIFPTAKELASWVGQCPANHQSAGKRRSGRTRNGSKRLEWALEEAAPGATRSTTPISPRNTPGCAHDQATKGLSGPQCR